ncbi:MULTISPECIES: bifunctional adenosylcobinamide kinase/adenosylcobinamide-phosphate guanylyltransferase [unclassified Acinetobacter]|uniref:bifunctional adenosylcobinamide kinase/adenosylcobinamide-phosphate guanylyltransferase n=1 Tax=unclassified Acinetobacter TaxID=196816 RepID=UPI0035BA1D9A
MIELFLGGARSGKSRHAEQRAKALNDELGLPVMYLATAQAFDDEMTDRIVHHQNSRPNEWQTIEQPIYLAQTLQDLSQKPCVILVDCLTLWLNNLLCHDDKNLLGEQKQQLLQQLENLKHSDCYILLVSNETGLGIVPMGQLSRQFVDESGFLHQQLAQMADNVTFFVAGLPMVLKG